MVLWLLSGLPPKPRGARKVRSAWRRYFLESGTARSAWRDYVLESGKARSAWRRYFLEKDNRRTLRIRRKRDLAEFARKLREERGNVESALVVIPLMTLFLIAFQLVLTINNRNIEAAYAQSSATHSSITGRFEIGDRVINLNSADAFNDLRAVVTTHNQNLPNLVPFLGSKERITNVHGFSILENQS